MALGGYIFKNHHYKKAILLSKFNRITLLRFKRIVWLRVFVVYGFKFLLILGILILVVAGIDILDEVPLGDLLKCKTGNISESECCKKNNPNPEQCPLTPKIDGNNTSRKSNKSRNLGKHLFDDIESLSILAGLILFVVNIPEQKSVPSMKLGR